MHPAIRSIEFPEDILCADIATTLFPTGTAVWLDAGVSATTGRSVLGTGSSVVTASGSVPGARVNGRPRLLNVFDFLDSQQSIVPEYTGFPFGWAGWLGYETGVAALGLPTYRDVADDTAFVLLDRLVVVDHDRECVTLAATESAPPKWIDESVHALRHARGAAERYVRDADLANPPQEVSWRHSEETYRTMIARCTDAITSGDAYQVCLTTMAQAPTGADPLSVALRLRVENPSRRGGFFRIAGQSLVSSSPEEFLTIDERGTIRTRPIKGTRPRGQTVAEDVRLRLDLEQSVKERAENVMIVDLMRNDLNRVCTRGSVAVRALCEVESYAHVHQLVSTVTGTLSDDSSAVDALRACFPAGSMTGAPKESALRLLYQLEGGPRGAYAGCHGLLAHDGSAQFSMTIRSIQFCDGVARVGSGGGITALSNSDDEVAEARLKADAVVRAAGLTIS